MKQAVETAALRNFCRSLSIRLSQDRELPELPWSCLVLNFLVESWSKSKLGGIRTRHNHGTVDLFV